MVLLSFPKQPRHARASTGSDGYKSGRSSERGTPDTRSTASTRNGGTSSHCETACTLIPSGVAIPSKPPAALIARRRASALSLIVENSSTALPQSQALLHCGAKALLYPIDMTMGERITAAMERLEPPMKQVEIARAFDLTAQAVSQWINDKDRPDWQKLPALARLLKVPCVWLIEGKGEPPRHDDPMVLFEALDDRDRLSILDMMETMGRRRPDANPQVSRRRAAK